MYEYFNPNPRKKNVGDCVIRAICKALHCEWREVLLSLFTYAYNMSDMPSSNSVWGAFLRDKGFHKSLIPDTCPDCYTIKDFCMDHPQGEYIVCTGNHTVAVQSGTYFDSWDSGDEIPIYYFWR